MHLYQHETKEAHINQMGLAMHKAKSLRSSVSELSTVLTCDLNVYLDFQRIYQLSPKCTSKDFFSPII